MHQQQLMKISRSQNGSSNSQTDYFRCQFKSQFGCKCLLSWEVYKNWLLPYTKTIIHQIRSKADHSTCPGCDWCIKVLKHRTTPPCVWLHLFSKQGLQSILQINKFAGFYWFFASCEIVWCYVFHESDLTLHCDSVIVINSADDRAFDEPVRLHLLTCRLFFFKTYLQACKSKISF